MPKLKLERKIAAPAEIVWSFVSWTGYGKLAGTRAFQDVRCDGDEIGTTRILVPAAGADPEAEQSLPEGIRQILDAYRQSAPLTEKLVTRDREGLSYSYEPLAFGTLPITAYRGDVKVIPIDDRSCVLSYVCDYTPADAENDSWPAFYELAQSNILNLVQEKAEAAAGG